MTGSVAVPRLVAPSKVAYKPANTGVACDPWDSYWTNSKRVGEAGVGGPKDEALQAFWGAFFIAFLAAEATGQRILDLGSGDGAVTAFALNARTGSTDPEVHCLDISPAALALVRAQYPSITPICASAASIPVPEGHFHAVLSQFGMEYAGIGAVAEAARVLRPGGQFAAVLHQRGGAIHDECRATADALQSTLDSGVLGAFSAFLHSACALRDQSGSEDSFNVADRALAPRIQALEAILKDTGTDGAGKLPFAIYRDIAHMYRRPYSYSAPDIEQWVRRVEEELIAFRDRMEAMVSAALDESALAQWRGALDEAGVALEPSESLAMGADQRSAAWVLRGVRRSK